MFFSHPDSDQDEGETDVEDNTPQFSQEDFEDEPKKPDLMERRDKEQSLAKAARHDHREFFGSAGKTTKLSGSMEGGRKKSKSEKDAESPSSRGSESEKRDLQVRRDSKSRSEEECEETREGSEGTEDEWRVEYEDGDEQSNEEKRSGKTDFKSDSDPSKEGKKINWKPMQPPRTPRRGRVPELSWEERYQQVNSLDYWQISYVLCGDKKVPTVTSVTGLIMANPHLSLSAAQGIQKAQRDVQCEQARRSRACLLDWKAKILW